MGEKTKRMLVVELNAAEQYFLNKYVAEGKLPTFAKLLQLGKILKTQVSTSTQQLSPWIIWTSIYTGLKAKQHGIVGFGQAVESPKRISIYIGEQQSLKNLVMN